MKTAKDFFELKEDELIRRGGEFYLSVGQLSDLLFVTPRRIRQVIVMHRDELNEFGETNPIPFKTESGIQSGYLLSEEQIYILCMHMNRSQKAREFRIALAKLIKSIRNREYVHISEAEKMMNAVMFLNSVDRRKLGKYKKIRDFGLNRKQSCRALELPYATMKRIDKVLGIESPFKGNAEALKKYRFPKKQQISNN